MSDYIIEAIPVGPLMTNCCILGCKKTKKAIVIDPGGDFEIIKNRIRDNGLVPEFVVNTHAHIDHIGAIGDIKKEYGIKFGLSEKDLPVLDSAPQTASLFNLDNIIVPRVDFYLKEGDVVEAGNLKLKVIETPGHTKGSICFHGDGFLIAGDTLFKNSIGRTDLPGGSYEEIFHSITKKLLVLDDTTVVYPGHGETTTIAEEKLFNPFIKQGNQ